MAKVGLKDTLRLMAAGYTKKEIDALAAADDEQEKEEKEEKKDPDVPAPVITDSKPAAEEKKDPEPDYKEMYEKLKKENEANKATITKLQQDNVHKDSTPDAEKTQKEQAESLNALVRSFM